MTPKKLNNKLSADNSFNQLEEDSLNETPPEDFDIFDYSMT